MKTFFKEKNLQGFYIPGSKFVSRIIATAFFIAASAGSFAQNAKPNNTGESENKSPVITLDSTEQRVLVAYISTIPAPGGDTSYIIGLINIPLNNIGSTIPLMYNMQLYLNPNATIYLQLANDSNVIIRSVLTGKKQSKNKASMFSGMLSRDDKMLMIKNNVSKIIIDLGNKKYEYLINENYASGLKTLFNKATP
ncbi:MAG TPA: hypothetical protein PLA68_08520 [Panacibacter sp.]|nr:hypothetical protein [Panacibacter sp.]